LTNKLVVEVSGTKMTHILALDLPFGLWYNKESFTERRRSDAVMTISTGKTRIRTYESALRDVKYPDENGKRPLRFNPKTTEQDNLFKHHRRNSEGEIVPRDADKYNFDC
jgi:hypothetical protein